MLQIIKRPVITEKAMKLASARQYVFAVDPKANKIEIKKAIEEMFEVDVISVRTVNIKGKNKIRLTRRGLMRGRTPNIKKAYVTLKEGQSIELVSGPVEE
ncbi:MAG TPA: 50S ribosomal protein L23 [Candidatus Kapabacteria bacterium]|jgi:large subunit ribosomal protein L23|nr:50S ribosomal protein L23 [Candidatus Kapabacteria bacterium]HOM04695.1 50S ribosomal protein L23 [Candidatus Kapabacteria bacterium]HPP39876.1 50S ribosomal protein L23 [Candidatus Kapabacteria bacterium]HPU23052.1 50S ribosomal protein L23 [Candidatus Kapabacteria bacterium]